MLFLLRLMQFRVYNGYIKNGGYYMKKSIALLLVLLMVVTFVACKPAETPAAETPAPTTETPAATEEAPAAEGLKGSITVQVEEPWKPFYDKVAKAVTDANPDAKIDFVVMGSFDHLDTIDRTNADNPDVADVFAYPADRYYGLFQNEVLAAFDAKTLADKIGGWTDFDAGFAKYLKDGNDYFGIPMNIESLLVFVNKANADKAGVDITKPVEFTALDPNALMTAVWNAWYGVSFTNPAGIELLAKDGDTFKSDMVEEWANLSPDKQQTIEALFKYFQAHATDKLWDADAAWGFIDESVKTGGPTMFVIEGPWNAGKYSNDIIKQDLEVMPLSNITLNGKPLSHWKGGWAYGLNARIEEDPEKMALAEAFLAEALKPEHAVEFYKATGKISENADRAAFESSDLDEVNKKVIATVYDGFEKAVDRPLFSEWGQVWDTYQNGMLSWKTANPANAEAAFKVLQDSFKAMMGQVQK